MSTEMTVPKVETQLYSDVCSLIENTRGRVATTVNAEVIMLNWQIGVRIKNDVLFNQRAEYGKQVIKNLAVKLTDRYGKCWSFYKLQHCVRSAYTFSEEQIVYAVRTQFTWTHLRSLMSIDDELKREFYIEMCRLEHWDTRTLDESNIKVAQYYTQLPDKKLLAEKLHKAIAIARENFEEK
jgi:hypothetical protein